MITVAEKALESATERADSPTKKAELARISEAFAAARASLSEEDRRENTLARSRAKRSRPKQTA
jgi:hypothetical protein